MADNFTTAFEGDKIIDGAIDHHIFMRAIVDGTGANVDPVARDIFVEIGSNVDPQTGRAYFDMGNRADNSLTVLSGPNAPNGTIGQNSSHIEYSDFMKARAVEDVKIAYQQTLTTTNGDIDAARRAAGRVATGWANATKALLLGAIDTGELPGAVSLNGTGGTTVFQSANYDALETALKDSDFYKAGLNEGLVLDTTTRSPSGLNDLFNPKIASLPGTDRTALINQLKSDFSALSGNSALPSYLHTGAQLTRLEVETYGSSRAIGRLANLVRAGASSLTALGAVAYLSDKIVKNFMARNPGMSYADSATELGITVDQQAVQRFVAELAADATVGVFAEPVALARLLYKAYQLSDSVVGLSRLAGAAYEGQSAVINKLNDTIDWYERSAIGRAAGSITDFKNWALDGLMRAVDKLRDATDASKLDPEKLIKTGELIGNGSLAANIAGDFLNGIAKGTVSPFNQADVNLANSVAQRLPAGGIAEFLGSAAGQALEPGRVDPKIAAAWDITKTIQETLSRPVIGQQYWRTAALNASTRARSVAKRSARADVSTARIACAP